MKKLFKTVLFLTAVLTTTNANARVWRVNPNPNSGAEYTTVEDLQKNYDFVEGDTILLDPGRHADITLSRKNITVIGTGYFVGQNEEFAMNNSAVVNNISISENSTLIGIYIGSQIWVQGLNYSISRCFIKSIFLSNPSANVLIDNCYICSMWGSSDIINSIIRNNIFLTSLIHVNACDITNKSPL